MKDEEMAEEYADRTRIVDENTRAGTDCISLVQDYEGNYIDIHERIKQAFLAGLKAGRPQWYKPSERLPDQYDKVLNEDGFGVFYDSKHWRNNDAEQDICDEPKYWCEIPTFDKE